MYGDSLAEQIKLCNKEKLLALTKNILRRNNFLRAKTTLNLNVTNFKINKHKNYNDNWIIMSADNLYSCGEFCSLL